MHQYSFFEGKNCILTGTIKLILINGICGILSCKLAFQLHRYYRNSVYKKHYIYAVLIMYRVVKLSGTMKNVRLILNLCSLIQSGLWLPENRIKLDSSIHKTMPHNIQKISCLDFSFKTLNNLFLGILRIDFHISIPFLRLACLNKFHKCFIIKSRFTIKFLRITLGISAMMNQIVFNVFFKSLFFYIKIRHGLHLLFPCDNLVDEGFFVFLEFIIHPFKLNNCVIYFFTLYFHLIKPTLLIVLRWYCKLKTGQQILI